MNWVLNEEWRMKLMKSTKARKMNSGFQSGMKIKLDEWLIAAAIWLIILLLRNSHAAIHQQ